MNLFHKRFLSLAFLASSWSCLTLTALSAVPAEIPSASSPAVATPIPGASQRNVVLILSDDHRYDVMSFMGHPFVETPNMDRLAKEGVHFSNALVTTSLCSPSRASILTGLVTHRHGVSSNAPPAPPDAPYFPQYLQSAGYLTAFVGKWHMGYDNDSPRRGFDHWVAFKGQGSYVPGPNIVINVNGRHVPQNGYITDELTDYAVDWLEDRSAGQPFFLYLSHKAVHQNFTPAERHEGSYASGSVPHPPTMPDTEQRRATQPEWVGKRRFSNQGIGSTPEDFAKMDNTYRKYCEAVRGIDDSIGRVLATLEHKGMLNSTLVIYMSDNCFSWGEHGLTNKRHGYEESMRIPMLVRCPQLFKAGTVINAMVANIDIPATILEIAGLRTPAHMDGHSFLELARGKVPRIREHLVYEYYWERRYATTPSFFAIRTERYKYVFPYGVMDKTELYDLPEDPWEQDNLSGQGKYRELEEQLDTQLFEELNQSGALKIALDFYRGPRRR